MFQFSKINKFLVLFITSHSPFSHLSISQHICISFEDYGFDFIINFKELSQSSDTLSLDSILAQIKCFKICVIFKIDEEFLSTFISQ